MPKLLPHTPRTLLIAALDKFLQSGHGLKSEITAADHLMHSLRAPGRFTPLCLTPAQEADIRARSDVVKEERKKKASE